MTKNIRPAAAPLRLRPRKATRMPQATAIQVAEAAGGRIDPAFPPPEGKLLSGLAPLSAAGPEDLSWYADRKYQADFAASRAGAVLIPEDLETDKETVLIRVKNPELAMALASGLFIIRPEHPGKVLEGALVDPSSRVAPGATVYPLAVVGPGSEIGEGAVVYPLAYVGAGVKIGPRTVIQPQAALLDGVSVGADCLIQAGAVVGTDGFGFAQTAEGSHVKIPQGGTVSLEDGVELGANAAVDRAFYGATRIGRGSKLDNLVQVAHNVDMGPDCALASQAGISGSVTLGQGCILGGQAGLADHITLGDRVMVGAQAGTHQNLEGHQAYLGSPALPLKEARRVLISQRKLPDLIKRVRDLEKRLAALEAGPGPKGE